jgi:V/A-type H+/Na+-transporting ATPase subunit C
MDYCYVNARIRGMKSRLLSHKALDDLILKPDMDSLVAELENTPYKKCLEAAGSKYSGIYRIEYALRDDFTRTFRKIMELVTGSDAERYLGIFLQKWDIQNVKTVLRGKSIHAAPEEIFECLLPISGLDEATLTEMVRQPDIKAVIDLMATWKVEYARPLTRAFSRYAGEHDLVVLESALDRYYYENALAALQKDSYDVNIVRGMLAVEIDVTNIKTALRLTRDRVDAEEAKKFLIEGGRRLNPEFLLSMIRSGTVGSALEALEPTLYAFIAGAPEELYKKEKISGLEKLLDRYLIMKGIGAGRGDPLSVAVAIGYFWAKYNEMTNLRIIARCKTADMPVERVKEELTYA